MGKYAGKKCYILFDLVPNYIWIYDPIVNLNRYIIYIYIFYIMWILSIWYNMEYTLYTLYLDQLKIGFYKGEK